MPVVAPEHLLSLINHFRGDQVLRQPDPDVAVSELEGTDLSDIKGQETAKRALEITAAGGHNLLMIGPPGSGKSMLAARLSTILPPLDSREMLEVSMVHPLAGELMGGGARCAPNARFARPITRPAWQPLSAAARARGQARSRSPIAASVFWMDGRNSAPGYSTASARSSGPARR